MTVYKGVQFGNGVNGNWAVTVLIILSHSINTVLN